MARWSLDQRSSLGEAGLPHRQRLFWANHLPFTLSFPRARALLGSELLLSLPQSFVTMTLLTPSWQLFFSFDVHKFNLLCVQQCHWDKMFLHEKYNLKDSWSLICAPTATINPGTFPYLSVPVPAWATTDLPVSTDISILDFYGLYMSISTGSYSVWSPVTGFFIWHKFSKLYSWGSLYQYHIPFQGQIKSHRVDKSHFMNPLLCWWMIRLFLLSGYYEEYFYKHSYRSFCVDLSFHFSGVDTQEWHVWVKREFHT